MTGVWYHLRLVALRQAALAPALVYVGLVALVYASDAGPPVSAATVTAVALMPTAAWLYRLVATVESLPFADITLIRLHGRTRRQLTWMVSAVLLAAALGAAAAGWARLANPHPYPAPTLVLIGVLHLAQALAGVGLGCLISRPLPVPVGAAVLAVTSVVVVSLVVFWLPPLGPMLAAFAGRRATGQVQVLALAETISFGAVLAGTGWALDRSTV